MQLSFPGESAAYRDARRALLDEEIALRAKIERVAELRRALPEGGQISENYAFTALDGAPAPLSNQFTSSETLLVYSLMYRADAQSPCPMCISMLDGLDGQAEHIAQRADLIVVAAATPDQLRSLAKERGWSSLRLLSTQGTTYQSDYHAETGDGEQLPMMNVFRKTNGVIRHFWGSEGLHAPVDGQPRHVDMIWPLWNVLDMTPEGRGTDWYPALSY